MRNATKSRAKLNRAAMPHRSAFVDEFGRCWICGYRGGLLSVHEITSGAGRKWGYQHREAWLLLCCDCHAHVHSDWHTTTKIAREYALKRIRDPQHYDRQALNVARCRAPEAITGDDVRAAHSFVTEVVKW